MIEICYAIHDKNGHYAKFVGTSIQSILDNTCEKIRVHIMHDYTLTQQNIKYLMQICNRRNIKLCLYNVQDEKSSILEYWYSNLHDIWLEYYSPAVLYRLIAWDILPDYVDRLIYLDADILVCLDIGKLWNEDTGADGVAAVIDSLVVANPQNHSLYNREVFDFKRYFNTGVLLMQRSNKCCGREFVEKITCFFNKYPLASFPDQDALNYIFDNVRILPDKYNRIVGYERLNGTTPENAIYHFSGESFRLYEYDVWMRMWWDYFCETPWCNSTFIERLMTVSEEINMRYIGEVNRFFKLAWCKSVVVVYEEVYRENVMLTINREMVLEMIPCKNVFSSLLDFVTVMKKLDDNTVFVFFVDDFKRLYKGLISAGCRADCSFDGRLLLSQKNGGYSLDENQIIVDL